jgi:hypothetical protein
MIDWREYSETKKDNNSIQELVGIKKIKQNPLKPTRDTVTNRFLVRVGFKSFNKKLEVRFAYYNVTDNVIVVEGMFGNIRVTHWSEINVPQCL